MRNRRNYNRNLFFYLRLVFTIFCTESFQFPPEKDHPHLKCQFPTKIPIWPKSLLNKRSEKWLNPSHRTRGRRGVANYNLFYSLPKPTWLRFSFAQYHLGLKLKLSLTINDWFVNFPKIRKKCSVKLSKWIANCVLRTINSNPTFQKYLSSLQSPASINVSNSVISCDHSL